MKMKFNNYYFSCLIFLTNFVNFSYSVNTELPDPNISENPFIDGDHIVNATLGKVISMKCIIHNIKNYKIAWYFNGILLTLNNIRIKNDKRYSVENLHPHEWTLIIDPVDPNNEGEYTCRLTNGMKRAIFLKVGIPPVFTENNGSHQIVINTPELQNITLSCQADGNPFPSIFWYREAKLIATGPHLHLHHITRHSHSEYECVARNSIEPAPSRHFKINVNFEPTLKLMYHLKEPNKKLVRGSKSDELDAASPSKIADGDLQLVCEIHGNPINYVSWYKDDLLITDGSKRHLSFRYLTTTSLMPVRAKRKKVVSIHTNRMNSHKFISKLRINNFDDSDNGLYKCSVNGLEGDVSRSLFIDEISKTTVKNDEYSLHPARKNTQNSRKNNQLSHLPQNLQLNSDLSSDEKLIESSMLMHAREARSNSTINRENIDYNNSENSVFKIKVDAILALVCLIAVFLSN